MGAVLVTGASRGIGASVAKRLAKTGFDLVLWSRTGQQLVEVAEECRREKVDVITAEVDVSDSEAVFDSGVRSIELAGELRGLVLNAGIGIWGKVAELSVDDWRQVVSTNLDGAFYTLRACMPFLGKAAGAQIVTLGSDSSLYGYPTRSAYCASKSGLVGLVEALRRETRADGLRISNVILSRVDSYFRNKKPGARPQGLTTDEVAEAIEWIFSTKERLEVRELRLSALTETFGVLPEFHDLGETRI
tara:strand:- start:5710 stop:6450 length:741 start_codon:yes stop_codon:yes gene_type:complete